jgi:uncharacterized protein (TIGR02145 family)
MNPTVALTTKTSDGTGTGSFTSSITGLTPNTTYHVRAYATNSVGTNYGGDVTVTTPIVPVIPTLTTGTTTATSSTTASSGGSVTSDGGATVTARGVCWSTSMNPTVALTTKTSDGTGTGSFTSSITGLTPNTTYHVRAYATNSVGTNYGNEVNFTTLFGSIIFNPSLTYGTITDIENNTYKTIEIGLQLWMAENLKTTKYNDGSSIPLLLVTEAQSMPCYYWYNDDPNTYRNTYGALYNWYAVITDRLCPIGWHVPSDDDWTKLIDFLGGEGITGDKLKEIGTTHWLNTNTSSNESGFTGLPGGWRGGGMGEQGFWWSSTENDIDNAFYLSLMYNITSTNVTNYFPKNSGGFSVRCVKNIYTKITTYEAKSIMRIFPNPVFELLNIEYNTDNEAFKTINIFDSQGRLLAKEKAVFPRQQIDFSKYSPGFYILEFINPSGKSRQVKIVKY